jgi:hypothetical protein
LASLGLDRRKARDYLVSQISRGEGTTSFYWENEETEELLDLLIDAVAGLIEQNNREIEHSFSRATSGW